VPAVVETSLGCQKKNQPIPRMKLLRLLVAFVVFGNAGLYAQTLTVTNGLALWLKADAGVTTNASGGVIQWDDQSTNVNNAVQVADSQAPLYVPGSLNNRPVLRFDGVDDFLNVADSDSLSFAGDLTTLFVVRFDDFGFYNAIWSKTAANLPAPTDLYTVPGDGFLRVYRGDGTFNNLSFADSAQPLRANTYLVLGVDVQGDVLTHYLNAQPNGSGTVNTNTADANTDLKIGSRNDLFTKMKGDIAELLIYDRALSGTERSNAFNYLQTKYNLLNLAPSVTLSSSPTGPNVSVGDVIRLTANPIDLDGTIARVEFFGNGVLLGTVLAPPYAVNVRIESAGVVTFTARAVDNKDGSGTSNPVTLQAGPGSGASIPLDGLQLWLNAGEGVSLGANNAVVQWADQSGNANNAQQIDETMAPVLVPNALNGLPVVRFDGANDFMDVADSDNLSITGDICTFYVIKLTDFATFRSVWGKTVANQPAPNDLYILPSSGLPRFFRGNGVSGAQSATGLRAYPANNFVVAGVQAAGSAVTHYLTGRGNGSGTITTTPVDGNRSLRIGSRDDGVTRMKGDLAELVIYDRALSGDELRGVMRYLGEKYAIPEFTPTNASPVVTITAPTGVLPAPGTYTVTVEANDPDGAVTSVQIFANGLLYATDTTAPYSTEVHLNYGGKLVLYAVATDNQGAQRTSATVTLCVQGSSSPAGLVCYWPMDGNADAVIGLNGALVNGPVPALDRNDVAGGALLFDGSQLQRMEVPGGGGLSGATQGTISMWVKWTGAQDVGFDNSFGAVLGRQRDGVFSSDILNLSSADPNTGVVQWRHNAAGPVTIAGNAAVGADTWHHIAVTFDSASSRLFVDGSAQGSGSGGPLRADTVTPLAIGAWTGGGGSYCTATIDDVAIWNRVLRDDEISDLAGKFITPLELQLQPDCLAAAPSAGGVMLRWGSDGVLQHAPDIVGPWDDVPNPSNPYPVPAGTTLKFYRLRSP
jgi:hypothetical protein